jgi:hypothetical protein
MPRPLVLVFALFLLGSSVAGAQPAGTAAVVQGRITDAAGAGVPYASVHLAGTTAGASADTSGRFHFSTGATGSRELRARAIGYAPAVRRVELAPGDTLAVRLVLEEAVSELEEVVVAAEAGGPPALDDAPAIDALEAVTTPGTSGDPLRAVKLLPGALAGTAGSGLFVRGGEKGETRLLLDGAPVAHPYRQETPTGGAFGTLPPFLVEGLHFSTGGFSARYGARSRACWRCRPRACHGKRAAPPASASRPSRYAPPRPSRTASACASRPTAPSPGCSFA